MKALVPLVIALVGLGAGVGAGLALKPAPVEDLACAGPEAGHEAAAGHATAEAAAEGGHGEAAEKTEPVASVPCPPAAHDPLQPEAKHEAKKTAELAYVPLEKPFVVPIFKGDKVAAMVVVSLSVETDTHGAPLVETVQPRLRDSFLKVMFRHANSGGFDGSFTMGPKMDDLKSALLAAAREVMPDAPVDEVLITEIARQDG